jgi:hypothetical protein
VLHRAVLGGDRGALDQRQQVALHAFAADRRRRPRSLRARDLVDLVEEDDAVLLPPAAPPRAHRILVQQLVALLGQQQLAQASPTRSLRRFCAVWPKALPNMSPRLSMPICRPACRECRSAGATWYRRPRARSRLASSVPSRSSLRNFCRVSSLAFAHQRLPGRAPRRPARPWRGPPCGRRSRVMPSARPRPGRG